MVGDHTGHVSIPFRHTKSSPSVGSLTCKRRSGRMRGGNSALRATLADCARGAVRTRGPQFHGTTKGSRRACPPSEPSWRLRTSCFGRLWRCCGTAAHTSIRASTYDKLLLDCNAARWLRKLEGHGRLQRTRCGAEPAEAWDRRHWSPNHAWILTPLLWIMLKTSELPTLSLALRSSAISAMCRSHR